MFIKVELFLIIKDVDNDWQVIPMDKIEDFGVHLNEYYSLDVSFFKNSLDTSIIDALWNKFWINTIT
jgi:COP9 signalosome complex subunit 5